MYYIVGKQHLCSPNVFLVWFLKLLCVFKTETEGRKKVSTINCTHWLTFAHMYLQHKEHQHIRAEAVNMSEWKKVRSED